ncbi:transmembrane protein [Cystoisospora suis]|uniref:Transmembrane protein n=1 Tax=Cystoisospora suis TaxID=483139 RepID=A0A2C6KFA1_9APIC|nr:transmembrane protein [Cystoisospora suis]
MVQFLSVEGSQSLCFFVQGLSWTRFATDISCFRSLRRAMKRKSMFLLLAGGLTVPECCCLELGQTTPLLCEDCRVTGAVFVCCAHHCDTVDLQDSEQLLILLLGADLSACGGWVNFYSGRDRETLIAQVHVNGSSMVSRRVLIFIVRFIRNSPLFLLDRAPDPAAAFFHHTDLDAFARTGRGAHGHSAFESWEHRLLHY